MSEPQVEDVVYALYGEIPYTQAHKTSGLGFRKEDTVSFKIEAIDRDGSSAIVEMLTPSKKPRRWKRQDKEYLKVPISILFKNQSEVKARKFKPGDLVAACSWRGFFVGTVLDTGSSTRKSDRLKILTGEMKTEYVGFGDVVLISRSDDQEAIKNAEQNMLEAQAERKRQMNAMYSKARKELKAMKKKQDQAAELDNLLGVL